MIPKRIRRTIIVDGQEYEYCVTGFIDIFIKNLKTKKEMRWYNDWKPKWKQSVKPSDIKNLILTGEMYGIKAT